jgi:Ubiquitin-binding domain/Ubiquitin family
MGNYCARSEPDDSVIKSKFSIGKDYQEIEGQFLGQGVKKTVAWKATISRQQLESKREEFWNTRTTGRRNIWLVIKNAIEADHETSALLLQMSGISLKSDNVTVLEDTNGNIYEIPPFIINDPVCFSNERKKAVPKQNIIENIVIKTKIRRPGEDKDACFEINNMITALELKQMYAEKESFDIDTVRLFFGGKEMNYDNSLASHLIQTDMVITAFIKSSEKKV